MTERITSDKVHKYVQWLHETVGFDISTSEDACGLVVTNKKGDTRLSYAGKPREIKQHFMKGYITGFNAGFYNAKNNHGKRPT